MKAIWQGQCNLLHLSATLSLSGQIHLSSIVLPYNNTLYHIKVGKLHRSEVTLCASLESPAPSLPSDKPAADSCRGSSCGSPAIHPRSLCARTASRASPRCICSYTPLSGAPCRRSAGPWRSHQTDAGPGTSAGTGPWCAGPPRSCWALPPCSAPHCDSRCCKTLARRCRTAGRRAPGRQWRWTTRRRAGLLTRQQPLRSLYPSSELGGDGGEREAESRLSVTSLATESL